MAESTVISGVLAADAVEYGKELFGGKTIEFDGEFQATDVTGALRTQLSQKKHLRVSDTADEHQQTSISIFDIRPIQPLELLRILIGQRIIPDQEKILETETKLDKTRRVIQARVSPLNVKTAVDRGKDVLFSIVNAYDAGKAGDTSGVLSSLSSLADRVTDAGDILLLQKTACDVIEELGRTAEKVRKDRVSQIRQKNEEYKAMLLADAQCGSCGSTRKGEEINCPNCGHSVPQRHFLEEELKKRMTEAGLIK